MIEKRRTFANPAQEENQRIEKEKIASNMRRRISMDSVSSPFGGGSDQGRRHDKKRNIESSNENDGFKISSKRARIEYSHVHFSDVKIRHINEAIEKLEWKLK